MPPAEHTTNDNAGPFEGFHIYHTFEIDASLRDDPVVFYKREMFLQMFEADMQFKDTRFVLLATAVVTAAPMIVALPPLDTQVFHQFLSTVFQGFCGLLGLLAVALVYYLQQLKEEAETAVSEFRQFLAGSGCSVSTSRPLEMWKEAETTLRAIAKKKRATVDPHFISYLHARTNYCTRLDFAPSTLRLRTFMLLPPSLLLLAFSLAGLALGSLGPGARVRSEWPVLATCVLLSSLVIVRCLRITRQYFWVKLKTARMPEGMEDLPPDTFPAPDRRNVQRSGRSNGPLI